MKLTESYKQRLKILSGIINEGMSIGQDGQLKPFSGNEIDGNNPMKYTVTYTITTPESAEQGDFDSHGYEVEPEIAPLYEIVELAKHTYGANQQVNQDSWESSDPVNDRAFFEKGEHKLYQLHITHQDGTSLTDQESEFINAAILGKIKWDDLDNIWK